MGAEEIRAYLSYLATDRKIAASTQNIALSALLFLYSQVFRVDLPNIENIERARQTRHLPVVLTREEIKTLLSHIEGIEHFDNFLLCCESSCLERIGDEGLIDFDRGFHRYFWGESYRSCFHPIIIVLLHYLWFSLPHASLRISSRVIFFPSQIPASSKKDCS